MKNVNNNLKQRTLQNIITYTRSNFAPTSLKRKKSERANKKHIIEN